MMKLQENPTEIKETEIWVLEMKGKSSKLCVDRKKENKEKESSGRWYWVV